MQCNLVFELGNEEMLISDSIVPRNSKQATVLNEDMFMFYLDL